MIKLNMINILGFFIIWHFQNMIKKTYGSAPVAPGAPDAARFYKKKSKQIYDNRSPINIEQ